MCIRDSDSPTPRLDAELLLAAALNKPRSYLRTWPEHELEAEQLALFQANLMRRRQGEPVAYILGHQGFWSLELEVAPHTPVSYTHLDVYKRQLRVLACFRLAWL